MRIYVFVLLAIAVIEAAALFIVIRMLVRTRKETGVILPVDILPAVMRSGRREGSDEWEIVDDVIQYEDDLRAEYYRQEAYQ